MPGEDIEIRLGMDASEVEAALTRLAQLSQQRISQLQRASTGGAIPSGAAASNVGVAQSFGSQIGRVQAGIRGSALDPAEQQRLIGQLQRQYRTPFLQAAQGAPGAGASRDTLLKAARDTELSERTRFGLVQATTKQLEQQGLSYRRIQQVNQGIQRQFQPGNYVQQQAQEQIARRAEQAAIDREVRAQTLAQGGLSKTQSLQVRSGFLFGRQNLQGLPPTLGQLAGQSVATVGRFAISGAAFYAVSKGITDTIKTAQELEATFNILESQMESLDQAGDLPQLKRSIFDIAKNTGVATDEVAKLATAFVGAFGDSQAAAQATDIAASIARVAQLEPGEVFNDLIAGVKAFAATPAPSDQIDTLKQIGDLSIQLRNTTGVAPKEIIDFLGRVGPIAKTTGLDLKEAAAAAATLLQGSSVSGAALGEQFGRILTGFSESAADIGQLAQDFPKLGISIDEAVSGDPSVLFKLAEGFDKLSTAEQNQLIQSVGSRREGQTLAILFQNNATLLKALSSAEDAEGRVSTELAKKKETLAQQVREVSIVFQQLGLALYNAGVGDIFKELISVAKLLGAALGALAAIVDKLPDGFVDLAAKAAVLIGIAKAVGAISGALSGGGAGGVVNAGIGLAGGRGLASLFGKGAAAGGAVAASGAEIEGTAALGGLPGLAIGAGVIATATFGPTIWKALTGNNGHVKQLHDMVDGLRTSAEEVATKSRTEFDRILQEAGGISNVKISDLETRKQKILDSIPSGFSDIKNQIPEYKDIADELKKRQDDEDAALIDYLLKNKLITKELANKLVEIFGGGPLKGINLGEIGANNADELRLILRGKGKQANTDYYDLSKLSNPKIKQGIAAGLRASNSDAQKKLTPQQQSISDVDTALDEYNAGEITLQQYNEIFERLSIVLKKAAAVGRKADVKALAKAIKDNNKANDDAARAVYDLQSSIADVSGGTESQNIGRLRTLRTNTRDPKEKVQISIEIAKAQKDLLHEQADQATSSAEAARILREGIPVDKETRTDLIYGQLSAAGSAFNAFVAKYLGAGFNITDAMFQQIAQLIEAGSTAVQALRQVIVQRQLALISKAASSSSLFGAIGAIGDLAGQLGDIANAPDLPEVTPGAPVKITDPGKASGAGSAADLAKRIAKAKLDLLLAKAGDDPVKQAQIAQQQADLAFKQADDAADRLTAQADRIKADKQLQDALFAITQAQIDLAIAYAEAADNTVESAKLNTDKAKANLAHLQKSGAGKAAIDNAKAAVVGSQAAERDAKLSDQLDLAEFQRQMGQITDGQYKVLLEQSLLIPGLTEKQKRDIQVKIHDLTKSLGADYQFNLPTELGLPTLYTARRLDQTNGGYNDNRQVTVIVNPSQGMDEKALAAQVVSQFSVASRVGVTPRIY